MWGQRDEMCLLEGERRPVLLHFVRVDDECERSGRRSRRSVRRQRVASSAAMSSEG